jgi:dipeptidase
MPLYAGITHIPHSFEIGDHWVFNRESARWAFDYVDFHTQAVYSHAIKDVRMAQEEWEGKALSRVESTDQVALELYKKDPAEAIVYLTDYSNNQANAVVNAWWKLGDDLLVKYNKLWIYDAKTRERNRLQFPDWYLKELIKYNRLKPEESEENR